MEALFHAFEKARTLVDEQLEQMLTSHHPLTDGLYKAAAYAVDGGKRIRPIFMFLSGELFDVPVERLIYPACSVELIHTASLIMDDLPYMDDSKLRRGRPTSHLVFGQDVALCSSVALLSRAFEVVLSDFQLDEPTKLRIIQVLTRSFGFDGLSGGQFVDLKLKDSEAKIEVLEFINSRKTAALFIAAGEIAAIVGRAELTELESLKKYAEYIGFAFQIIDDILDVRGDENVVGKNLHQDKMNFAVLVGLEEAQHYASEYTEKALQSLEIFGERAHKLKAFSLYLLNRMA